MSTEGPPNEKLEREPVTEEQCVEAMKTGNFELVQAWYAEQERISMADPTITEHLNLTVRFARLQHSAGLKETAIETLEAARMDAFYQNDHRSVEEIDQTLELLKKGGNI